MIRFFLIVCFLLAPSIVMAQTAVTGRSLSVNLAADHVDISLGFNGADLSLFGVKSKPGDIAIIVRGPEQTVVVRRKNKALGIWMNTQSVEFLNVPVYYDLAVSVPENELAPMDILKKNRIGLDALDLGVEKNEDEETLDNFREALIRNQQEGGHFPLTPKPVTFISDDFFRADFHVPADVPTGTYLIETILFQNGKVIDRRETRLRVAQVGFSARLYRFAYDSSFVYGLAAVFMAMLSGAGAHLLFRRHAI